MEKPESLGDKDAVMEGIDAEVLFEPSMPKLKPIAWKHVRRFECRRLSRALKHRGSARFVNARAVARA